MQRSLGVKIIVKIFQVFPKPNLRVHVPNLDCKLWSSIMKTFKNKVLSKGSSLNRVNASKSTYYF